MNIILLENISKLGKIGEVVKVKDGYARNFLLPNKMALRQNKKNLEYYEKIKEEIKITENKKLEEAKQTIENIKKLNIVFSKEADEKGQLYGAISKKEILNSRPIIHNIYAKTKHHKRYFFYNPNIFVLFLRIHLCSREAKYHFYHGR